MSEGSVSYPSRFLLEGTRVGFFQGQGAPEDLMLPGVMRAVAEFLGDDLGLPGMGDPAANWRWQACALMNGVTGTAFRYLWSFTDAPTLLDVAYLGSDYLDVFRHAFDALGLEGEFLLSQEYSDRFADGRCAADAATMRARIMESIAGRGMPVVVMGVLGPPEPCIVYGYDDDGETLIGWDHFQDDPEVKGDPRVSFEPSGCFRLRDWAGDVRGIYLIAGTKPSLSRRDIAVAALERGLETLRQREGGGLRLGQASFYDWIDAVDHTGDLDDEALAKFYEKHTCVSWDLAERRAQADTFICESCLRTIEAVAHPDLGAAADLFGGMHDMMYEVAEQVKRKDDVFDGDPQKLRDPDVRARVIGRIENARRMEERAILHIDRALALLRGETPAEVDTSADLGMRVSLPSHAHPEASDAEPFPETVALPNLLRMLVEFDGGDLGYSMVDFGGPRRLSAAYVLFMGASGEAFRYPGSILHLDAATFARTVDRAMGAAGYSYRLSLSHALADLGVPGVRYGWDDNLRRIILRHLRDSRSPVLLFGSGGSALVTGYDHHGQTLMGYGGEGGSQAQWHAVDSEANQARDGGSWPSAPTVEIYPWIALMGERRSPADVWKQALADAAHDVRSAMARIPSADGGFAACDSPCRGLAAMLRTDALFPSDDSETLAAHIGFVRTFLSELAERRLCAAEFLRMTGASLPAAAIFAQTAHAALSLAQTSDIGDPGVRAATAEQVERLAESEAQAVDALGG